MDWLGLMFIVLLFFALCFFRYSASTGVVAIIIVIVVCGALSVLARHAKKQQRPSIKKKKVEKKIKRSNLDDVDKMSGVEFELWLKHLFELKGYKVELTPVTGDYGADLILEKDGQRTVVQAKRYTGNVPIDAVQQVVSAKAHYNAHQGVVITNSNFTHNAQILAVSNKIALWPRDRLIEEYKKVKTVRH